MQSTTYLRCPTGIAAVCVPGVAEHGPNRVIHEDDYGIPGLAVSAPRWTRGVKALSPTSPLTVVQASNPLEPGSIEEAVSAILGPVIFYPASVIGRPHFLG